MNMARNHETDDRLAELLAWQPDESRSLQDLEAHKSKCEEHYISQSKAFFGNLTLKRAAIKDAEEQRTRQAEKLRVACRKRSTLEETMEMLENDMKKVKEEFTRSGEEIEREEAADQLSLRHLQHCKADEDHDHDPLSLSSQGYLQRINVSYVVPHLKLFVQENNRPHGRRLRR